MVNADLIGAQFADQPSKSVQGYINYSNENLRTIAETAKMDPQSMEEAILNDPTRQ